MNEQANRLSPRVVLYGGTGQAKVVRPIIEYYGSKVVAVIDDTPDLPPPFPDVPLYQGWAGFEQWKASRSVTDIGFCIAIGGQHGRVRLALAERLKQAGLQPLTLIHPAAHIEPTARIGEGGQILAGAVVCAHAVVGRQCIVGTNAVLEHECELGDGSSLATSAVVLGLTKIGVNSLIGANATVLNRLVLGDDVVVGAGMVASMNIAAGTRLMAESGRAI